MQASTSPDGNLNLQLDGAEAEDLRRSVKIAVSAMVTLYARAGMRDAKDFFVKLDEALQWSGTLGKWFDSTRHEGVRVLGPAAAPILRLKQDYRYHFVLKSDSREKLNAVLRSMLIYAAQQKIPRTQVIVDVDAVWLM